MLFFHLKDDDLRIREGSQEATRGLESWAPEVLCKSTQEAQNCRQIFIKRNVTFSLRIGAPLRTLTLVKSFVTKQFVLFHSGISKGNNFFLEITFYNFFKNPINLKRENVKLHFVSSKVSNLFHFLSA